MAAFDWEELLDGTWLKIGEHGHSFCLNFHEDGTFTESHLFSETGETWTGVWENETFDLFLYVTTPTAKYMLAIHPLAATGLHEGLETDLNADPSSHQVRFRLVHVKPGGSTWSKDTSSDMDEFGRKF
jgi:hypothetical protein